jgi:hypothetical protein
VARRWPAQGVLATCIGDAGRGSLARVLAGLGRGDGVLWVGAGEATTVGVVQGAAGQRAGSGCVLPPLLQVSRLGSGQRGLGSTKGASQEWLQGSSEGEQRCSQ